MLPIRDDLGLTDAWLKDPWHMQAYVFLSISIPVWFYFAAFDRSAKGTPGKQLLSLRITKSDGSQNLGFGIALVRSILKLLPWELAHLGVIFPRPLYYYAQDNIRFATYAGIALLALYIVSIVTSSGRKTVYDHLLATRVSTAKKA